MDLLDRLLGHDAWTTNQLLELAEQLDDHQLDHEFDIAHRSVRRTLAHLIGNVECWTDLMKENGVRPAAAPHPSVAILKARYHSASAEFLKLAREIVDSNRLDETFLDVLDRPPQAKTFGGAILHLATHGMHHRAHLLFMMKRLGVEGLPEGDALSWESSLDKRK